MLDDFFEKIDKLIEDKNSMPACDSNNAENQLYSIDKGSRILSINDKQYLIPDFFNMFVLSPILTSKIATGVK